MPLDNFEAQNCFKKSLLNKYNFKPEMCCDALQIAVITKRICEQRTLSIAL